MQVQRRYKLRAAVVGVLALGLTATGCSSGGDAADGPVTLQYYNFTAGADHAAQLDAIIAAFNKENPNIKIEVTNGAFDTYFTDLQTRIAGGTAPDTFELNYENFVSFAASGALLDLAKTAPDVIKPDKFYPKAYNAFNYKNVQYGLPESFSNVVLYYNKDLFDAAGLDYPTKDWTWQDEQAAAEKLTDSAKNVWGDYQPYTFNEFYKALAQNGGSFFDDQGTKATFNSPEGVAAAKWLTDKVGKTMPTTAQMGGKGDDVLFEQGQIAMWHTGIWMFGVLAKNGPKNWDIAVEPGNTTHASHFFSNAAVVSATSKHPVEAAKWVNFLASSDETVKQRLDNDWELPAVVNDALLKPYMAKTLPANKQAIFDSLDNVVVPPVMEQQQKMTDIVTLNLQKVVEGQMEVQDALDDAAKQVDALLTT
jgi:multiple sugar transport system substrate-binding protein